MKEITLKEAKETIELYKTEDDYIIANIVRFMDRNNNPSDNSIELSEYYQQCLKIFIFC